MDEFEVTYDPEKMYNAKDKNQLVYQVYLRGIMTGGKTWSKSASVLQDMLR
jgi:hypothetical protein